MIQALDSKTDQYIGQLHFSKRNEQNSVPKQQNFLKFYVRLDDRGDLVFEAKVTKIESWFPKSAWSMCINL